MVDAGGTSDRELQRNHVVLLVRRLDGTGGVARSVTNLANGFAAAGLDVTVLTLLRRGEPSYPLDPRVRVEPVRDFNVRRPRHPARRRLDALPSLLHEQGPGMSRLTDRLLRRRLEALGPCTLITHRPCLHQAAAWWAPRHVVRLAVEHSELERRPEDVVEMIRDVLPSLDRLVVLTDDEKRGWAELLGSEEQLVTIPNGVPFGVDAAVRSYDAPVVVAAGSLIGRKAFGRLVRAFAPLAAELPEWRLRIFGKGPEEQHLEDVVERTGSGATVELAGFTRSLQQEMAAASLCAVSSHSEALPMVVLEAMGLGLPVVAFACPGVDTLVRHEVSGLLVPDGDIGAFTAALRRMMSDADLRARYGRAARSVAASYQVDNVVTAWRDLVAGLTGEAVGH